VGYYHKEVNNIRYLFITDDNSFINENLFIDYNEHLPCETHFEIDILVFKQCKEKLYHGKGPYDKIFVDKNIICKLFKYDIKNNKNITDDLKGVLPLLTRYDARQITIK